MTGAAIAAEIAEAYAEAGQAVGDGQGAVTATITRNAPEQRITAPTAEHPNAAPYAPVIVPGGETTHTFTAKPVSVLAAQRAGMALETGERVYSLVNHGVSIEPMAADELVIGGKTWSITEVIAKDAAGHVLTWLVKLKN